MPTLAQRVRLQLADENPAAIVYDNYDAATAEVPAAAGAVRT